MTKLNHVWVVEWQDDRGNWRNTNPPTVRATKREANHARMSWHRITRYTADPERKKVRSK